MNHDAIAERYALALYELAGEHGLVEQVLTALDRLRAVAELTPQLGEALSGAQLTGDEKKRLIADSLPGAPQLLLDFFALVIDKHRARHALGVVSAFRTLVEQHDNIVSVAVRSAVRLTEAEQEGLRRRLETMTGAVVRLHPDIDPGIIGGLIVQIGDKRIDFSLRSRLESMRQLMVGR